MAKTVKTQFTDADFDNWTQEQEDAAIAQLQKNNDVKCIIVEGMFVGKFPNGDTIATPLELNLGELEKAQDEAEFNTVGTIVALLSARDETLADQYRAQDTFAVVKYAEKWFTMLEKKNGISPGE